MSYRYGTYGTFGKSIGASAVQSDTTAVYFGTAPVNLVKGYKGKNIVNYPVKINNLLQAQEKIGYASDYESYTIMEAVDVHFNNPLGNVGPIYVINVLDPAKHKKDEKGTQKLNFTNNTASFKSTTAVLDTVAIADKTLGKDFDVEYDYSTGTVTISGIGDTKLDGELDVNYDEVDATKVTKEDIIGGVSTDGKRTGIAALELVYNDNFEVPNILVAPGWSQIPEVYTAMTAATSKINGHWDAVAYCDIPLVDAEKSAVDTIAKAEKFKTEKGYTSERAKVFWPMATMTSGKNVHISTLWTVEQMRIDAEHDAVPMETAGNKEVPVIKQYFGANAVNNGFGQDDGSELSSKGITTVVAWGGQWILWGDHTAAYEYGATVDNRDIFDTSIRMMEHITNSFQQSHFADIDKPFTVGLRDQIVNDEQEKLDYYVSMGALIGDPTVEFSELDNTYSDVVNGVFTWNIQITPTPMAKALICKVAYTTDGFSSLYETAE